MCPKKGKSAIEETSSNNVCHTPLRNKKRADDLKDGINFPERFRSKKYITRYKKETKDNRNQVCRLVSK